MFRVAAETAWSFRSTLVVAAADEAAVAVAWELAETNQSRMLTSVFVARSPYELYVCQSMYAYLSLLLASLVAADTAGSFQSVLFVAVP